MDYNKDIYGKWDTFPDCKMHITGEYIWGKVLPDGTYGINNDPLSEAYMWQDIVRSKELPEDEAKNLIIHRRWNTKIFFKYEEPEDKEESLAYRQKIVDMLCDFGSPGFFWKGVGYILIEEALSLEEAFKVIEKPLTEAGIKIEMG
jgi:hypothetical protein